MLNVLTKIEKVGMFSLDGFKVVFINCPVSKIRTDVMHLREALDRNLIEVSEISRSGTVNSLKVVNKSDKFIILFRGDTLVGGKQNRTLYTTLILAPKSENIIPVACVEAGRWRWKTEEMTQNLRIPQLMRFEKMIIEANIPSRSEILRNTVKMMIQSFTWGEISNRQHKLAIRSETSDVVEIVSKEIHQDIKINIPDEANGVIYFYDGKIVGGEVFLIPIDKSYIRDAIIAAYFDYKYYKNVGAKIESDISTIEDLIREIGQCDVEEKESVFEEKVKLIKSEKVIGFIVQLGDTPIYAEFSTIGQNFPLGSLRESIRRVRFLRGP